MEPSLDGPQSLLGRGGYILSHAILSDVIGEHLPVHQRYDLDRLNAILYEKGLHPITGSPPGLPPAIPYGLLDMREPQS